MGHSEMLLAVAGLSEQEIRTRTERLASGNWSAFPPAEQQAFRFAHQITREPGALSAAAIHSLRETFGQHRALDIIWYCAWCNYMTRVADAFQLPLERTNVFQRQSPSREEAEQAK